MKKAIKETDNNDKQINVDYFYRLLCTKENMILVHGNQSCTNSDPHVGKHVDQTKMFKCFTHSNKVDQVIHSHDEEMGGIGIPGPSCSRRSRLNGLLPTNIQNQDQPSRSSNKAEVKEQSSTFSKEKRKRHAPENGHHNHHDKKVKSK